MTTVAINFMFAACDAGVTGAKVNFKALADDGTILAVREMYGKLGGGDYANEPYSFRLCDGDASSVIAEKVGPCSLDFTWRNEPCGLGFPP